MKKNFVEKWLEKKFQKGFFHVFFTDSFLSSLKKLVPKIELKKLENYLICFKLNFKVLNLAYLLACFIRSN